MLTSLLLGGVVILAALSIQALAFVRLARNHLNFLEKNMQVGGTPIDLARAQFEVQAEINRGEAERIKELRAQRMASFND